MPTHSKPPAACLLALALAAALSSQAALAGQTPDPTVQAGQAQAVPLGQALTRLASTRGIALSFDPALTRGLQAPPLPAGLGDRESLEHLLAGSGLILVAQADNRYTLARAPSAAADVLVTDVLAVEGRPMPVDPYGASVIIDQHTLATLPAGNADIGSVLALHPAVRHDDARRSSRTPGDIAPAEISIHGAHFYQNAFLIDGVGFNNDIDPAQEGTPYRLFAAPGASQGMALDTALLERIDVLDHNISAAYGGFNGGVVDVTTRRPGRDLSGRLAVQSSRSAWTRYHIDPRQREDFDRASSWNDGQPEFEKTFVRAQLEGYVRDDVGLLMGISRRRSTIPTYFYSSHLVDEFGQEKAVQERRADNYFLKGVWDVNARLGLEASLTHAPERNHYFRSNIRGGGIDIIRDGSSASLRADLATSRGALTQTLGWSRSELSRTPESDDYMVWQRSQTKDWGTNATTLEGEFGQIAQQMDRLSYAARFDANPLALGSTTHHPSAGVELQRHRTRYARLTENSTYVNAQPTETCTNAAGQTDTLTCDLGTTINGWAGQFLTQRTRYATGEIAFDTTAWSLFLEDDIHWGRWQVRPGLRVDDDSYMGQTTLAPRLAVSWALSDRTRLHAGANRYYGRNVAAWRLQEGIDRLRHNAERRTSLDAPWTMGTQALNTVKFRELDIAYSDELNLGIAQQLGERLQLTASIVNRKGRDQVIQVSGSRLDEEIDDPLLARNFTTWTNDGRSESNTYQVQLNTRRPLHWAGTSTTLRASASYLDVKYASPTYANSAEGNPYIDNPVIRYRGTFMRYADRPMENYNRPWTSTVSVVTDLPGAGLQLSHLLGYRSGYVAIGDTGQMADYQGERVRVWDEVRYGSSFTWDLRLGWTLPLTGSQHLFANLDVFNVLDRVNVYGQAAGVNAAPLYETGRSFWLELGYGF